MKPAALQTPHQQCANILCSATNAAQTSFKYAVQLHLKHWNNVFQASIGPEAPANVLASMPKEREQALMQH